jgi:hypothetical protein
MPLTGAAKKSRFLLSDRRIIGGYALVSCLMVATAFFLPTGLWAAESSAPTEKEPREFSPDRPGSTNTPFTIEPGHVQAEVELVNYSYLSQDQDGVTTTTTTWRFPNPVLRVGLTDAIETQVAWAPQIRQSIAVSDPADRRTVSGIGDVNVSFKFNVQGNGGADVAWAVMPGIKIPTGATGLGNTQWEPTLMLPMSFALAGGIGLQLMPELDLRKNSSNDSFHTEFNNPITVSHHLAGAFDGYVEFVSHSSNEPAASWTNYAGAGLTFKLMRDMQFDVGCNFGLNSQTATVNPFGGWVFRY